MATQNVKPGKVAKFDFDESLAKPHTLSMEKNGKTFSVDSLKFDFTSIPEILAACRNDEKVFLAAASDFWSQYVQRSDRSKLSLKAQGPAKDILKLVKGAVKAGFADSFEEALDDTLTRLSKKSIIDEAYIKENRDKLLAKLNAGSDDEDDAETETEETVVQ